jgi:hypothetical protein
VVNVVRAGTSFPSERRADLLRTVSGLSFTGVVGFCRLNGVLRRVAQSVNRALANMRLIPSTSAWI